jgi:uncharacterized Rossmann fold enzyme
MISADLGYDEAMDHEAGVRLSMLMGRCGTVDPEGLRVILGGKATVVAKGPSLRRHLDELEGWRPLVSAGSATATLAQNGILPDVVVSDLDGDIYAEIEANEAGAMCFLHAHGDNLDLLGNVARYARGIVPTMQSGVVDGVWNFGGLTDGDRAVELTRHFGAREIRLVGFDLDWLESDSAIRRKKIDWAKRIIFDMNPRDVIVVDVV